jgi:hypothetical protein
MFGPNSLHVAFGVEETCVPRFAVLNVSRDTARPDWDSARVAEMLNKGTGMVSASYIKFCGMVL